MAVIVRGFTIGMIALFVGVQILLMLLCFFNAISLEAFFIEITVFTGILALGVNLYQVFVYCKQAGSPYRDNKSFRYVRHVGIVCGVWTFAFTTKFIAVGEGKSLF